MIKRPNDPEGGRMFIETQNELVFDPEGVVCGIPIHATTFGVGISAFAFYKHLTPSGSGFQNPML